MRAKGKTKNSSWPFVFAIANLASSRGGGGQEITPSDTTTTTFVVYIITTCFSDHPFISGCGDHDSSPGKKTNAGNVN